MRTRESADLSHRFCTKTALIEFPLCCHDVVIHVSLISSTYYVYNVELDRREARKSSPVEMARPSSGLEKNCGCTW
jgi:hypothetical protein